MGGTFRTCCPTAHPPHARVDSECKRWNLEHVVLDLFSHFTLGKVQVWWLFVSCRGSCPSNSPFALSRLANLTHAVAARFVSASPLGSTTTAVCCTSLTSNSSPPEIGRAVSSQLAAIMEARGDLQPPHIARERKLLQLRVIHLCARFGISKDRMWNPDERTQIVYEKKTDRVRPHGPIFPRQLVSHTPTRWIAQDALLDMIDAIDADMNARPGDAELIPWLLVLDCVPQHVAKEFRSILRDTRPHIKLCCVQRNFKEYTQPLDRAHMRAFKSSIRSEVAKHFAEFFMEVESNFETCQSGLHQFVAPRMQTARNIEPLAGASSIGRRWSSVSFSQKQNAFWRRDSRGASGARCRRRSQRQRARSARDGATGRRSQQRQ